MLLLLRCCFLESLECSSVLSQVPMPLLMAWEEESCSLILRKGLKRIGWWQKCFQKQHPFTNDRFHTILSSREAVDWRQLLQMTTIPALNPCQEGEGGGGGGGGGRLIVRVEGSELGGGGGGTCALIESGACKVWFCSGPGNSKVVVDLGRQEAFDGAPMRMVSVAGGGSGSYCGDSKLPHGSWRSVVGAQTK